MPLINSLDETRLKGLRYSGFQPLITKDVNDPPVYQSFMQEINSRGDDVVRLSKLLFTGQGLKFATNTAGLQAISPTTATKQLQDRPVPPNQMGGNNTTGFGDFLRVLGGVVTTIARSVVETAAIVPSTIAQAGTAGTGQRFVRGFAGGSGYLPGVRGHVRSKNGTAIEAPGNNEFSKLYNAETQLLKKDAALTEGEILDGARPSISAENIVLNQHRNKGRELYDFSDQNESDLIGNQTFTPLAKEVTKDTRLKLSSPNKINKFVDYRSSFSPDKAGTADAINMLKPIEKFQFTEDKDFKDMIKFKIEVINPSGMDLNNQIMLFRAYLDSFDDSYKGDWGGHSYVGRADQVYTYKGFDRDISLAFKAHADTRQELNPLYTKLNLLASTTAPSYNDQNNFMRGILVRLTVGDYLFETPGYFSAIAFSWQQGYPWEIKLRGDEEPDVKELPHLLNVSLTFKPIHDFLPQHGTYPYITSTKQDNPFFTPSGREPVNAISSLPKINSGQTSQSFIDKLGSIKLPKFG